MGSASTWTAFVLVCWRDARMGPGGEGEGAVDGDANTLGLAKKVESLVCPGPDSFSGGFCCLCLCFLDEDVSVSAVSFRLVLVEVEVEASAFMCSDVGVGLRGFEGWGGCVEGGWAEVVGVLDGEFTEYASLEVLEVVGMSCGIASEAESEVFEVSGGEASLGRFARGSSDGGVDKATFCSLFFRPKKL